MTQQCPIAEAACVESPQTQLYFHHRREVVWTVGKASRRIQIHLAWIEMAQRTWMPTLNAIFIHVSVSLSLCFSVLFCLLSREYPQRWQCEMFAKTRNIERVDREFQRVPMPGCTYAVPFVHPYQSPPPVFFSLLDYQVATPDVFFVLFLLTARKLFTWT